MRAASATPRAYLWGLFAGLLILLLSVYLFVERTYVNERMDLTLKAADSAIDYTSVLLTSEGPIYQRDGMLFAGETNLYGYETIVDEVKRSTGFGCTIFQGNQRVATTMMTPGTSDRALPTVADQAIVQQVLLNGESFRGVLETLSNEWIMVVQPLRDREGAPMGMLAAFQARSDFLGTLTTFRIILGSTLLALYLMICGLILQTTRRHAQVLDAQQAEERAVLRAQFFTNMSHELRTPLSAVLNLAAALEANAKPGSDLADGLDQIRINAQEQLALINNLLDVAKLAGGAVELLVEDVDIDRAITRVRRRCEPLVGKKQLVLRADVSPNIPKIRADFVKLQQILTNLVANAIKFTESGEVVLRARREGYEQVAIEIEDTGVGIPIEALAAIWEPFRQADGGIDRKFGGTGLGLAIVHSLVELHGGRVDVRSKEGEGTTFTVYLPVSRQSAARSSMSAPAIVPPGENRATQDH